MKPLDPSPFNSKLKAHTLRAVFLLLLAFCLLSFVFAGSVKAEADYNLTDLDDAVAETFGIDDFSAGLLLSAIILLFPTAMIGFALYKSPSNAMLYAIVIVDFVTMGFLVALGWLPYWIFLIVCLLVAVLFAGTLRDLITGKGG